MPSLRHNWAPCSNQSLTKEFLTTRERNRYLSLFIMNGCTTHSEACRFRFTEERSRKRKVRNASIRNSAPFLPPPASTEKEERELREAAIIVLLADKRMGWEGGANNEYLCEFKSKSNCNWVRDLCQPDFYQNTVLKNKSFWYVSLMILLVAGGP